MTFMIFTIALLFALVGLACVLLVAIGLPGAWMLIALAVVIELLDWLWRPEESTQTFPWWTLVLAVGFALLGELLEFIASALGAKTGGATRRGMIGSLIGALIGGIVGTVVLIMIPVLGSILGACIGAAIGAVIGELHDQDMRIRDTLRPATGAAIGRFLGTVGKLPCALGAWLVLAIAAFWP